jgi:hypothetical protein
MMPYVPFEHPETHTLAYRHQPVTDAVWRHGPTNLSALELDALYEEHWPWEIWMDYLRDHGCAEEDLPVMPRPSEPTQSADIS